MIVIHYFASIREALKQDIEQLDLPDNIETVADLIEYLIELHGDSWHKVFKQGKVLVAVNQSVAKYSSIIRNDDEVAFFPPVTGG